MLSLTCTFSLLKKYQKNKAFAALPKTGLHFAGLAKLARTIEGKPCSSFAQTVASLYQVFSRLHIEWGFISAGFLTANRLRPDGSTSILQPGSYSQHEPNFLPAFDLSKVIAGSTPRRGGKLVE
jgi:hypothetical protein